jgi:hypothetical protein
VKARIWKEDGLWEWDVRDDRPPATRSTGARSTWREAVDIALEELAWMASR